ncbi:hypothetical protein UT300018_15790 [Clostridium faecium]
MAEQFYTILTAIGKAKIANSNVLGNKINLTTMAVGDGNGKYYNPVETQESLVNEVWRGNVGVIATDSENSNWIVIETMIAGNVGGFFIREVGVFDDEGNLIAIGKYPETYKPIVSDGATKDLTIRIILEVSNASNVTLKIDPTIIMATKKDIETLDNKIKNIKIPVTKVNNKLGDVTLKAEDIKANNDKTIEENLLEVTSQMAEITKEIENIDLSANKVKLNKISGMNATEVQTAIQELFQFADNGKKNISSVIGSPLSNTDSFDSMKSKIQTMKNTFASNLTAKGQSSSGSDTLNNLINKIPNINTGKKWATGTQISTNNYSLEIRGLNFEPSIGIVWRNYGATRIYFKGIKGESTSGSETIYDNVDLNYWSGKWSQTRLTTSGYGYCIFNEIGTSGYEHTWLAIE